MVGACSIFAFATETTVEELKNCSKNENTAKNTCFGSLFGRNHWCVEKEITDEIENYEAAELNTFLAYFYAQKNNKKGEDYEPESLKVIIASFDRHFKNKGCTLSIVRDREFSLSKEVLEDKAKQLHLAGCGKRPNKTRQRRNSLEEQKTRGNNPEFLIQTH